MNRPSKITGTSASLSDPRKPERACVPQSLTFRFRTEVCEAHDTATATSCEECDRGMVDSICCVCNRIVPLDDDGYCAKCLEPSGWLLAEHVAYEMAVKL